MLYYIFRFLEQFNIPGAHIWSYISFRALLALILSLMISAWFGEYFIKWMKRRNISETARDPSIDPFGVEKKGVPTMGGIIIIVSILVPVILLGRMRNIYLLLMIGTTLWLGFLGFMDDYIKIFRKNKEGLKGRYKIVGQLSIGFIVGLTLWLSPDAVVRENVTIAQQNQEMVVKHQPQAVKSLKTTIPFIKNHNLNYSDVMSFCGKYKVAAGWVLFVFMTILVVTAVSNGANLNDGMDGMCAGNSAIVGVALAICLFRYHVYSWFARTGSIPSCIYRCHDWFPVVQRISCPGVHGRYGFVGYWRYYWCLCRYHPQGVDASNIVWHLLHREFECHHPDPVV